jgi:putative transposase
MDNNSLAHTKWNCKYHIVFIPKYRRKVMYGKVREDIREIIKTLCGYKEVEILEGNVSSDHVHMCVKIPPKISVSEFMGYLKGKSALMIFDKYPEYKQKYTGRHFWARGYYVDTVGRNEEKIREYIKNQDKRDMQEDGIKE